MSPRISSHRPATTPAAASGARDESLQGPTGASYETDGREEVRGARPGRRRGAPRESASRPSRGEHGENDEQCAPDDRGDRPPDTGVDVGEELVDHEVAAD